MTDVQEFHPLEEPLIGIDDYLSVLFEPPSDVRMVPMSTNQSGKWQAASAVKIYRKGGAVAYKIVRYYQFDEPDRYQYLTDEMTLTRESAKRYSLKGFLKDSNSVLKITFIVSKSGDIEAKWRRDDFAPTYLQVNALSVLSLLKNTDL